MPFTNVDPAINKRFDGPFLGWYDVKHTAYEGVREPGEYVKALMDDSVTFTYPHAEEAINRVEGHIDMHGPYHTLLGFSQGAILITMLTALRLQRAASADGPPPSWQHNVLVCGMPVRANSYRHLFTSPLDFPCTVAQGQKDPAYEYCRRLASQYAAAEYMEYPDGHRFPHLATDTATLAARMRNRL